MSVSLAENIILKYNSEEDKKIIVYSRTTTTMAKVLQVYGGGGGARDNLFTLAIKSFEKTFLIINFSQIATTHTHKHTIFPDDSLPLGAFVFWMRVRNSAKRLYEIIQIIIILLERRQNL